MKDTFALKITYTNGNVEFRLYKNAWSNDVQKEQSVLYSGNHIQSVYFIDPKEVYALQSK